MNIIIKIKIPVSLWYGWKQNVKNAQGHGCKKVNLSNYTNEIHQTQIEWKISRVFWDQLKYKWQKEIKIIQFLRNLIDWKFTSLSCQISYFDKTHTRRRQRLQLTDRFRKLCLNLRKTPRNEKLLKTCFG